MENRKENIIFHNTVSVNGFLWFWGLKEDALFKVKQNELYTNMVDLHCYRRKKHTIPLYGKIGKYENKLIGVPLSADEILIYDCQTGIEKYVSLPKHIFGNEFDKKGKFWDIVIDEKYAYLIGYWSNKILKLDLVQEDISDVIEINFESMISCEGIYFKKADLYENYLIVPSCQRNIVYVVDKDSMKYEVKEFGGTNDGFACLLIDECNIWLSPRKNGKFVRWTPKLDKINYLDYPEEFKPVKPSYGFLEKVKDDILAFPLHAKSVLRINSKTLKVYVDFQLTELYGKEDEQIQKTGFTEFDGEEITIYSWKESCFIKYNMKTCYVQKSRIKHTNTYYVSFMKEELKMNKYVNENDCPLEIFIHNIEKRKGV